jgi:hypothetical protein
MFTRAYILATNSSVALSGHGGDQECATVNVRGTKRWVPSPEMKQSFRPTP